MWIRNIGLFVRFLGTVVAIGFTTVLTCCCSQNNTADTSQLEESQSEEPVEKKKKKIKKEEEEAEAPTANGHDLRYIRYRWYLPTQPFLPAG